MRTIKRTSQFKTDFKRLLREKSRRTNSDLYEEIERIFQALADDQPLDAKYNDHSLKGNWKDFRDCHIRPDLVLIYRLTSDDVIE